jgi:type III pantothenate kinase
MIILIDSGNSRIKLGWLDLQGASSQREPAATAVDKLELGELGEWIAALPSRPQLAMGVNVAGAPRAAAISTLLRRYNCPVQWIRAQATTLGLTNRYHEPTQLGPDRWISMLGVLGRLAEQHPPFILACFGTATTIDTVSPDNIFEGGLILPGPTMMHRSLAAGTATLPLADGAAVDYPTDTLAAIASGIAAAQAGALGRQWLTGWRRYGQAPAIYVAGGSWPDVAAETERLLNAISTAVGLAATPLYVDNPVLDGLALLAARYRPPNPLN